MRLTVRRSLKSTLRPMRFQPWGFFSSRAIAFPRSFWNKPPSIALVLYGRGLTFSRRHMSRPARAGRMSASVPVRVLLFRIPGFHGGLNFVGKPGKVLV
jgi:hypothetical protein